MARPGLRESKRNTFIILGFICVLTALICSSCGSGGNMTANAASGSASADLSPTSVAFTSKAVGTATSAQTVTLTNSGNADLSVSSIAVSGTNAGDFSQTNNCGASIAAGANCTMSVTFKPTAAGTRTAGVVVTDSAPGGSQTVPLSGATVTTDASVSPTSLALGSLPLSTASPVQAITLSNTGNGNLTITSVAVSGANASDFSQTNNCGSSVAAGANCAINVTFKPTAEGTRTAAVVVVDTGSSGSQSVAISGTGTAPVASVSTSSVAFGNQSLGTTSISQAVTLENTGNEPLSISRISVLGTNASDFAETNNCGTSLAADASCSINLTFTPAAPGALAAALAITDNAAGSPQSVALSGNGISTTVTVSPSSVAFGKQAVGAASTVHTVTVTNSGNSALTVASVAVFGANSGDFTQTDNCGSSVAAGASCTISLTFKPAAAGARAGTLAITDNAAGSPQSVPLSGTGISTSATLSPSSVAFGSQAVGVASESQTVTLKNSGSSTLTITSIAIFGTNSGDFTQNNGCGISIAAGSTCKIVVLFTPSALGARAAVLSVTDNATGSPQSATLSGTGANPSGHYVALTWTESSSGGVMGYNIYRGTASGGEGTIPLNPSPVSGTSFTDDVVTAGEEYFYVVSSVGSDGVTESSPSQEASATVPSP